MFFFSYYHIVNRPYTRYYFISVIGLVTFNRNNMHWHKQLAHSVLAILPSVAQVPLHAIQMTEADNKRKRMCDIYLAPAVRIALQP